MPQTERLWVEERSRRIPASLQRAALKKLQMLNAAGVLGDLTLPPGNRLERKLTMPLDDRLEASTTHNG